MKKKCIVILTLVVVFLTIATYIIFGNSNLFGCYQERCGNQMNEVCIGYGWGWIEEPMECESMRGSDEDIKVFCERYR